MPRRIIGVGHGTLSSVFPMYGTAALSLPMLAVASAGETGGGGSPRTDLIFQSDWTGPLGSSSTVLLDNNKWSITSASFDDGRMQVVESTGLDSPSPNMLQVDAVEDRDGWAEMRATGLGVPAVGTYRTWRWYFRCVQPNGAFDDNTHPIQDANGLTSHAQQWDFSPINGTDEYTPRYDTVAGGGNYAPPAVPKGVTHRFEIQLLRVSSTQFRLYGSIFNTSDVLLYDSDDFVNENSPFDNLGDGLFTFADIDALDGLTCGLNGVEVPGAPFPFTYAYEGCFAVRDSLTDELIGPYHPDESVAA